MKYAAAFLICFPLLLTEACEQESAFNDSEVGYSGDSTNISSDNTDEKSVATNEANPANVISAASNVIASEKISGNSVEKFDAELKADALNDTPTSPSPSPIVSANGEVSIPAENIPVEISGLSEVDIPTAEDKANCLTSLGLSSSETSILATAGLSNKLTISSESVLLVKYHGNVNLSLGDTQSAALRGMCIIAGGSGTLTVAAALSIRSLFFNAQGSPFADLNFDNGSELHKNSALKIWGSGQLSLKGATLDCPAIYGMAVIGGSSSLICSNTK